MTKNFQTRRRALEVLTTFSVGPALGFGSALLSSVGHAQTIEGGREFPTKPVRVIVPFSPGGGADTLIRILAPALTDLWRQPIIIENKPGASGAIGGEIVAKAPADGYTLMLGSTAVLNERNVNSFSALALVSASPYVITVHPKVPAQSIAELLVYGRAQPGELRFGSSGAGSASHLSGELFKAMAHLDMLHIPYKGTGQALADLLAGHINIMFAPAQTVMPNVQAGKLRALAVTGARRSAALPDLVTAAESGLPGYESVGWFGLFGPAKMPTPLRRQINADVNGTMRLPRINKEMMDRGSDPGPIGSDEDFTRFLHADMAKWERLIRERQLLIG